MDSDIKRPLIVATTNRGKLPEICDIMADMPFEIMSLDDAVCLGYISEIPAVVEDGKTFEYNALKKATEIMRQSGITTLADDSGLEIDFLGGLPGVDSAYYLGADTPYYKRNKFIVEIMQGVGDDRRAARFVSVITIVSSDGQTLTARGMCEGIIAHEPMGDGGFGYDPIFFVPSLGKTFAQLSSAEKNAVSHRSVALRKIKELL